MAYNPTIWKSALYASAAGSMAWLAQPAWAQDERAAADDKAEIVVTGTLLRQTVSSSPLAVVSSEDITARALTNAAELVNTVTANSGSEAGTDQLGQPLTSGTAQFNLRNLGLGSTLVLLNNRRQTLSAVANNDGSTFVDINSLVPLIAVQRLEVVKDGAAATYGSDAVAGVVNFITRKSVDRPEISARVNFIDGAQQYNLDGIAGFEVGGGDLVLAASYYKSTRLASYKRKFSTASTFGRPAWHSVSSYGMPGSYFVPSLGGYRPDPDCTNAAFPESYKLSPNDFCRFDFSGYYDLIPKEERIQVFGSYNATLGDDINLNLEAAYAKTKNTNTSSPSFPILAISPTVPGTHPDNPFGQNVTFRGRLLNGDYGPSITHNNYETFRLAGGLDGEFGKGWHWSVNAAYSQQTALYNKPDTIKSKLINALNGLGGPGCNPATGTPGVGSCHYFNPFGSAYLGTGTANSPELIRSLIGYSDMHGKASLMTVDGLVSGDLFQLGGETVQAALGVQYRRSTFRHDWSDLINAGELITLGQAPDFSGSQETYSVFGEIKVPLGTFAEANFSGRYEKYKSSFGRFTPKISLLAHPVDSLTLRASWGQAFRAPGVYQQFAVQSAQPGVTDPKNGNSFVFVNTQTFGNRNLDPERSTNWNLGLTFNPVRNIELNFDYYNFRYKHLIVKENPQPFINQAHLDDLAGLTNTPAQQRVHREINGNLQQVDLNFINASSVEVEGFDAGARAWVEGGFGRLELRADWSHVVKYDIRIAAGGAVIDGLGSVNFNNLGRSMPQDRVEYGLNWSLGAHNLDILGHYISGYKNDRPGITNTRIKSFNTYDIQYRVDLGEALGLDGTTLSIGAVNVFDKQPPVAQLFLGFDPMIHDPRGRVVHVGLNQKF